MIVSSMIKKYRKEQYLTQDELAKKMNISKQSISKWERGDSLPSIENLITLSDLLDLSLDKLTLSREEMPLPFDYGKFKSKKRFIWTIILSLLLILLSLFSMETPKNVLFYLMGSYLFVIMIQGIGINDLRSMYNYFTIKETGIVYFSSKRYCPSLIRAVLALFDKRDTDFISYADISEMKLYFSDKKFKGHRKVISCRTRRFFYKGEWFELILFVKSGEQICLNLDKAFLPKSDERQFFYGMFHLFESKGIVIKDKYHILNSLEKEYDLIDEACKLKERSFKGVETR